MTRLASILLICFFQAIPLVAASSPSEVASSRPDLLVSNFQQLRHYELFCHDETWGDFEPKKIGSKFEHFYSNEFYKLFLWSQCGKPHAPPPHFQDLPYNFFWDIRFGIPKAGVDNREGKIVVENIRVQPAKYRGADKASVKVLYELSGFGSSLTTTYALILEDGRWKIDDITPKGYTTGGAEPEELLRSSKSIKTEMQNNYRKAEARYQQELAKKRLGSKP